MQQAYEDFKQRFFNSAEQLLQDQRCHKKRSRMQAYLQQVFGHHNGIWDYLETGVITAGIRTSRAADEGTPGS